MTLYEKINMLAEKNGGCLTITQMNGEWEVSSYGDDTPLANSNTSPYVRDKSINEAVNKALERCFELEAEKNWDKWSSSESDNPTFDDTDEQKDLEYSKGQHHGEVILEKGD